MLVHKFRFIKSRSNLALSLIDFTLNTQLTWDSLATVHQGTARRYFILSCQTEGYICSEISQHAARVIGGTKVWKRGRQKDINGERKGRRSKIKGKSRLQEKIRQKGAGRSNGKYRRIEEGERTITFGDTGPARPQARISSKERIGLEL